MDIADKAQAAEERFLLNAMKSASSAVTLQADGYCHFCEEATERVFCCLECRDDYDREVRLRKILQNK